MTTVPIKQSRKERNPQFEHLVTHLRMQVEAKGVSWSIPLDEQGKPTKKDWDLRVLNSSHGKHAAGTGGFAVDSTVRQLAIDAGWPVANLPDAQVLTSRAQDFIKAIIAQRCLMGRTADSTQIIANAAKRLLSSTSVEPDELAREHFEAFLSLKKWSEKFKRDLTVVAKFVDNHLLSQNCPVQPGVSADVSIELLEGLGTRSNEDKLPEKEALYELTRIVFREVPTTFNDRIYLSILRLLILTGLRITEVLSLPEECLEWEEHIDVITQRNASTVGGVGRSLRLLYFAAKQRDGAPDLLIERRYYVPSAFETLVVDTVNEIISATAPLRKVLAAQSIHPAAHPNSDIRVFRTSTGRELGTWHLLFLTLFTPAPFPLPADLTMEDAVRTAGVGRIYTGLGRTDGSGSRSYFEKYGTSAASKGLSVQPHSLRHLMNTELFRLNVPDTVITHHFGRASVAQSYEYDHRNLLERLKFVELPGAAGPHIPPGSTQEAVAKMVVSGIMESSHLGRSFRRIQSEHGDSPAFAYLAANSDGFHVTPYGFCTNSFSMNPCARHLKCFDNCRHFAASGIPEHRTSLEELRGRLIAMRISASNRPVNSAGKANQIKHAATLINGVEAALAAQPNERLFPTGPNFACPGDKDVLA